VAGGVGGGGALGGGVLVAGHSGQVAGTLGLSYVGVSLEKGDMSCRNAAFRPRRCSQENLAMPST
jgi:hypothetical protein